MCILGLCQFWPVLAIFCLWGPEYRNYPTLSKSVRMFVLDPDEDSDHSQGPDPFLRKSCLSAVRRDTLLFQWNSEAINTPNVAYSVDFDLSLMYLFLLTGYTFSDSQYQQIIGFHASNSYHMECFHHLLYHIGVASKLLYSAFPNVPLTSLPLRQVWNLLYTISISYRGIFYVPILDSSIPIKYKARFNNLWVLVSMLNREHKLLYSFRLHKPSYDDDIINAILP